MFVEVSTGDTDKRVLVPRDILPDHIVGLVESLYSLGGRADPMHIGDLTGESIALLPKVIDVAETLGLVKYENGYLTLEEPGRKVAEADPKRLRKLLRELVIEKKVEPLHEIYEMLVKRKSIPRGELTRVIEKHYKRMDEGVSRNILVWGAYLGMFKLSEDDSEVVLLASPRSKG